jgi:hypothetical protein
LTGTNHHHHPTETFKAVSGNLIKHKKERRELGNSSKQKKEASNDNKSDTGRQGKMALTSSLTTEVEEITRTLNEPGTCSPTSTTSSARLSNEDHWMRL